MGHIVNLLSTEHLTHDVLRLRAKKPAYLSYLPGQAVDISLNKEGWKNELRAFTFTSLPEEDHIEFIIKTYPDRKGVTNQLLSYPAGSELIVEEPFGDIHYKGEGIFIAGGAGITPFVAIFKQLEKENRVAGNKLIFANKTKSDIILESHFQKLLGKNFINVLSNEELVGYEHGFISAELLKKYSEDSPNAYYYLCGPPPMMAAIEKHLAVLGVKEAQIVKEAF